MVRSVKSTSPFRRNPATPCTTYPLPPQQHPTLPGGQPEYYPWHKLFLTQGALYVAVVDLADDSSPTAREDALLQQLDILHASVPGAVVVVVGTKADLLATRESSFEAVTNMQNLTQSTANVRSGNPRHTTQTPFT